jgi:hypothetical protein
MPFLIYATYIIPNISKNKFLIIKKGTIHKKMHNSTKIVKYYKNRLHALTLFQIPTNSIYKID